MSKRETKSKKRVKLTYAEKYSFFYQLNKELVDNPFYKDLSGEAKGIYAVMGDKLQLSKKNKGVNKEGEIYIYFTIESVMKTVNCGKEKANKIMNELRKYELIETERQGLNKPNKIYVLTVNSERESEYKPKSEQLEDLKKWVGPRKEEVREFARTFGRKLVIDPDNFYYTMFKRGWKDKNQQTIDNWKALFTTGNNNAIKGGAIPKSERGGEETQKDIPSFKDSEFSVYEDYMNHYYPIDPDREILCQQAVADTRVGQDQMVTYTDLEIENELR